MSEQPMYYLQGYKCLGIVQSAVFVYRKIFFKNLNFILDYYNIKV